MAINSQDIIEALKTAVVTAVNDNTVPVYDTLSIQGPVLPMVMFSIVNDKVVYYFDNDDSEVDFQVDIYGKSEDGIAAVRALSDTIFNALHRASITITGADNCSIIGQTRNNFNQDFISSSGRTARDRARIRLTFKLRASNAAEVTP